MGDTRKGFSGNHHYPLLPRKAKLWFWGVDPKAPFQARYHKLGGIGMWRECRTARTKTGRVTIGDRARVWGLDDCGRRALLTGMVARIRKCCDRQFGTLVCVEIVDEDGVYLWEAEASEFEKIY